MFTGIIEKIGLIRGAHHVDFPAESAHSVLTIETEYPDLTLGESVAVNGVCLTVARLQGSLAEFYVSPETLLKTQLGTCQSGHRVNLERALTLSTRLSGHLVLGHVDGMGQVASIEPLSAQSTLVKVAVPTDLAPYCVDKGSIALNGVSLTINRVIEGTKPTGESPNLAHPVTIELMIIPHTWENTQFSSLRTGDSVNLEADYFAKLVERTCRPYLKH